MGARPLPISKQQIAEALRASGGIYTHAAQILGCAPNTVKARVLKSPMLQRIAKEVRETTIDIAESMLIEQIQAKNMTAIIFYLKTIGRQRGYVERRELVGGEAGSQPIAIMLPPKREEPSE